MHKSYNASRLLYLETDTSGVSLGAGPLQVKDGHEEVPDNATLHPTALTSKSL